jgi:hypothetical protein
MRFSLGSIEVYEVWFSLGSIEVYEVSVEV